MAYTHLHLHTEYSLLDGCNKIETLASTVKQLGMDAVAMSDHGNMFGAIHFYKVMKAAGIKPIIGMEAYIHNGADLDDKSSKLRHHLCLFAKDKEGYENLMYLSSLSFLEGFYFYPRINKQLLRERSGGLICTSACLQGEISFHLNESERNVKLGAMGFSAALDAALEYKDIFGEDFYIEIMRHGIAAQRNIDTGLIAIAKKTGIKLIATNDSHYNAKEDASVQEVAMCVAMGKTLSDENRLKHTVEEFYIKSEDELARIFADIPEALEHTKEIASKCNLELDLDHPTPPDFPFVDEYAKKMGIELSGEDDSSRAREFFRIKCLEGLKERLEIIPKEMHKEYYDRLEMEMEVISSMSFVGYMLIVWDFIDYAQRHDIPVGPGRGSAAGSLVAYSLKITDLDPIKYTLLFERFLNPERVSMPDIDTDFCQRKRDKILEYVTERYGRYNVAQVVTFNTMKAKGAIRDTARVLGYPLGLVDKICKLIPDHLPDGSDPVLKGYQKGDVYKKGMLEIEPKLAEVINEGSEGKRLYDLAQDIEGLKRNTGIHACAVVIDANRPLWERTPLFKGERHGNILSQYEGKYLESVDLVKFDFLGLKTLTVINDALKLIEKSYGVRLDFSKMGVDDKTVYDMLSLGASLSVFQLDSEGMQSLCRRLKPTTFEDLIAILALYRPGPMESGMLEDFIARKHGKKPITYAFSELEPILAPTYGVIVYQEQVMQIVQVIGGFSLGGADLVRRAMGKKKKEELERLKTDFVEGALAKGFDAKKADALWELILKFAGYGFNKSHSAAYAFIAYQTAYLKAHYKSEFMAAILTSEANKTETIAAYIAEARSMGIEVLPPHVNASSEEFSVYLEANKAGKKIDKKADKKVDKKLRSKTPSYPPIIFGLSALKSLGHASIDNIIKEREEHGPYKDLADFITRIDFSRISKKGMEPLIKSGSLDGLGYTRRAMLEACDELCIEGRRIAEAAKAMSDGLFGQVGATEKARIDFMDKEIKEYGGKDLGHYEYECMGIYLSGHPLDDYREQIEGNKAVAHIADFYAGRIKAKSSVIFVCKVLDLKRRIAKSGNAWGEALVLDFSGQIKLSLFKDKLSRLEELLASGEEAIVFKCRIDMDYGGKEERLNAFVSEIMPLDEIDSIKSSQNFLRKGKARAPIGQAVSRGVEKSDALASVVDALDTYIIEGEDSLSMLGADEIGEVVEGEMDSMSFMPDEAKSVESKSHSTISSQNSAQGVKSKIDKTPKIPNGIESKDETPLLDSTKPAATIYLCLSRGDMQSFDLAAFSARAREYLGRHDFYLKVNDGGIDFIFATDFRVSLDITSLELEGASWEMPA